MRTLLGVVLVACGCAHVPAQIGMKPARFGGERSVAVAAYEANDDFDYPAALEIALERRGFRVSRVVPNVATPPSRYVVDIKGICYPNHLIGTTSPELLKLEVYETDHNERLMLAAMRDDRECPSMFFNEVATAMDQLWVR